MYYMIRFFNMEDGLVTGGNLFTFEQAIYLVGQYGELYLSVDGLTEELAMKFMWDSKPLPGYWNSSRLLKFVQCWVHYYQMGVEFNWEQEIETHDFLFTHYND